MKKAYNAMVLARVINLDALTYAGNFKSLEALKGETDQHHDPPPRRRQTGLRLHRLNMPRHEELLKQGIGFSDVFFACSFVLFSKIA
jgi:hypothetical protein